MKFQCDRCQTRYQINEEMLKPGKAVKIRCRSCAAVISVRDGVATTAPPPGEVPGATPPAAPPGPGSDVFDFEVGEVSNVFRLDDLRNPTAPPPVVAPRPPRRKRGVGGVVLLGLAVAVIAAAVVVIATRGGEEQASHAAAAPVEPPRAVAHYYDQAPPPPVLETAPPDAAPVAEVVRPKPNSKPAHPVVARHDEPRPVPAGGKDDSFDDGASSKPLTPDDVRDVYAANEVGLKRCYERSLKEDPTLNVSKMDVMITVGSQGAVKSVKVPRQDALGTCVAGAIRGWRFRRGAGELNTEFTVYFAKRG